MAVNYTAGHLYTDDRRCSRRTCRLYLVVLDLRTGRELARVRVKGTRPSTGRRHGYVTRVTAAPPERPLA
jgi:hypothetical protein